MKRPLLAALLVLAGCSAGAPTSSPSPAPPGPSAPPTTAPTAAATATAAPTAAATPTAGVTAGDSCDPDMSYGCDYPSPSTGPGSTPSQAGSAVVIAMSSDASPYLLGPTGYALYTFDNDSPTHSACAGGCAEAWPPLIVDPGFSVQAGGREAEFATITRDDGSLQLAVGGKPLYYYAADTAPGDTNGDGIGGVWHLAR